MTPQTPLSRRTLLGSTAALLAGSALPAAAQLAPAASASRRRVLRAAHITDAHVDGKKGSDRGLAACFRHIAAQKDPVDVILNTGDTVMCVNGVDAADAQRQWNVWSDAVRSECRLPLINALGNHDSWGWATTADEPLRGKRLALERLAMPERFHHVKRGGWSILALDSILGSYTGRLDEPQLEWLRGELAAIPATQPVCVLTHIPIISACGFFDGERCKDGAWTIPGSWMHEDAAELNRLFLKHSNVRLCLSGHMHQVDRIDFHGVAYICGGAVSASWWNGRYYQCDYGYGLVNFYDDGSFDYDYVTYGWQTAS